MSEETTEQDSEQYTYFVAYNHPTGSGSTEITTSARQLDYTNIIDMCELVRNRNHFSKVTITNIIPLPVTHPDAQ